MAKTKEAFKERDVTVRAWSDSQVVLAWLQGEVSKWDRYVANRVTRIKQTIPSENWAYIKSEYNPADCASRGLFPAKLQNFNLWWKGPEFLQTLKTEDETTSEKSVCLFTTKQELKPLTTLASKTSNQDEHFIIQLLNKCSSLQRVTRVTAWVRRFGANVRNNKIHDTAFLTASELAAANDEIIKCIQRNEFEQEYKDLMNNKTVSNKSSIFKLNPYLEDEIIRLGGRLNYSNWPPDMKNPVILPHKGRLTQLLIDQAHSATLHGGARLTLAFLRQRYWIVGGNRAVKTRLRHHIRCHHRYKSTVNIQKGDIVLVKDNNLPPGKWAMDRVLEVHPGADGYVRVTTIKTQTGVIKRPVVITITTGAHGSVALSSSAHITSLESDRPIYYDTIGKMQSIHDEWTLLMYYNLTNYWSNVQRIEAYIQNLGNLCEQTDPRYCKTVLEQLSHEKELLQHYNSILLAPHQHLADRKKRGLINGIGNIANSLFGILDQQFAEKYQNDIEAIKNNEDYLLGLLKNQTSIVEIENKVMKKTEDNINRQFNMIEGYMNQTEKDISRIESTMEAMMATTYFNSASLTAYLLLKSMRSMQEMIFDSLIDVYKGHMDVHILSPVDLIEQLSVISGKLPKSLTLPIENVREDIKDVYRLLYVKARVTSTYFLFEVHVPLTSDEDFQLYKAYPLPIKTETGTTTIQLQSQYVAVNFLKSAYISMTEDDVKLCTQLKPDRFICNKNLLVFNLQNNNAPCEAKLLSHNPSSPCDVKKSSCDDAWIALHEPNSWLAICCKTCSLRTICETEVTAHTITRSSIITLAQGCILQSKDFTIYSHNEYNTKLKMDQSLHIPTLNSTINNIVNLANYRHPRKFSTMATGNYDEETKEIDSRLLNLKEHEVLPTTMSAHDIHHYAISYSLLVAAILGVLVWLAKKYASPHCNFRRRHKTRSPYEDMELRLRANQSGQLQSQAPAPTYSMPEPPPKPQRAGQSTATNNVAFDFD